MRKDSFKALSCLLLLLSAGMVFAEKRLILKNTMNGMVSEIGLTEARDGEAVSLAEFCRSVKVMYEYDRITRKAILQNGESLMQVADGTGYLSATGDLVACARTPFISGGAVHVGVEDVPALLSGLELGYYDWSVTDRSKDLPAEDAPEPAEPQPEIAPVPPLAVPESDPVLPSVEGRNTLKFVVLDAGHGGQDPGGIGLTGLREKIVVQKVTRMVERKLRDRLPGVDIVLTRSGSEFISLPDRTRLANQVLRERKSGVFVSVHANISRDKQTSGYETYFLSENATDDEARAVAALENNVLETEREDLSVVNRVLSSMLDAELIRQSRLLAECVTEGYGRHLPVTASRGVRTARFYVLEGAMMPSVLTEIGFLSNRSEERMLRDDAYLERIADGIVEGIMKFSRQFDRHNGFT